MVTLGYRSVIAMGILVNVILYITALVARHYISSFSLTWCVGGRNFTTEWVETKSRSY